MRLLRFLGRKSEVIVTASGVNLHPEDIEAAIDQQPGVLACAVVGLETAAGPEPCAVLAFRGTHDQAARAIERANEKLAEFQRILRWELWPEPDLPRTSTGKVRRKAVAEWLAERNGRVQAGVAANNRAPRAGTMDWLLKLITQITGEPSAGSDDNLRLTEDLHLDSLGRVQLAAAIEERLGTAPEAGSGTLDHIHTLGELRRLLTASPETEVQQTPDAVILNGAPFPQHFSAKRMEDQEPEPALTHRQIQSESSPRASYIYPHWPWLLPVRWLRVAFLEVVVRPLVWLFAKPAVAHSDRLEATEPMLIVANHVTSFDGPLLEYALPGPIRRRMAVAMSGEMLEDFRHFRNPERAAGTRRFFLPGPLYYLLVTALFNVFPLPKHRDFQRSFAHAGDALDHGLNLLVFPEGARSVEGKLAQFRPGIGLLVKQFGIAILPMALRGLGELKARHRRWFHAGAIEVRVGQPIRFSTDATEAAITALLHLEVEKLLND